MALDVSRDIKGKIYFLLLLFVAFITPTAEALPIKLASISVILLSAYWLLSGEYRTKIDRAKSNKLLWLFLALFLINLLGLLKTQDLEEASDILVRKLPLLLFPLVIATSHILTKKQINSIIIAFIVGLFATSLFTFRDGLFVVLDRTDLTTMVELTVLHRPYAGMFSIFAILGLIRLYGATSSLKKRIFIALAILYFLFFIYVIYAKMSVIALIAIASVFIIISAANRFGKYPVIAVGALIILTSLWYVSSDEKAMVVVNKLAKFEDFSYKEYNIHLVSSINIRYINWGCSIKVLRQDNSWLTGLGIGNTQDKLNLCYKDLNPWIYENQMNAHNEYLEETLRNGIAGLLILLLCLLIPLLLSIRYRNYTYLSFLVLISVCCITENVLSRQAGIMFYAMFTSLFAFNSFGRKSTLYKEDHSRGNFSY